jgi:hypothetical protein
MEKSRSALKDDFAEPIGRRKRGNTVMEVRPSFTPIELIANFVPILLR